MLLAAWIARYIASFEVLSIPAGEGVSGCIVPVDRERKDVAPQLTPPPVVGSMKPIPLHQPTAASGGAHPPTFRVVSVGQAKLVCTVFAQPSVKNTATFTTLSTVGTTTLLI